jgi:RNA polymerase sigma-54 factor
MLEDAVDTIRNCGNLLYRRGEMESTIPILDNAGLPHLRINSLYRELLSRKGSSREVREYIRKKIRAGLFLICSIQKRQQTILGAAEQIVSRQQKFLRKVLLALYPMTMWEIAKAIGVHETTVSRAVSGKYMDTPLWSPRNETFLLPDIVLRVAVSSVVKVCVERS